MGAYQPEYGMNKRDRKILAAQDALARMSVSEQAEAYGKMLRTKPRGRAGAFVHFAVQLINKRG